MTFRSSARIGFFLTFVTLFFSGCVTSTGVVKTGPDTYMISHSEKGTKLGGAMKAAAITEALKFCESQGKVLKIISSSQKDMVPFTSDAYAEIHFKCLDPNDPETKTSTETGNLANRLFKGDENNRNISIDVEKKEINATPKDPYAELEKLGNLLQKGLITKEEFETEKKKLLGGKK